MTLAIFGIKITVSRVALLISLASLALSTFNTFHHGLNPNNATTPGRTEWEFTANTRTSGDFTAQPRPGVLRATAWQRSGTTNPGTRYSMQSRRNNAAFTTNGSVIFTRNGVSTHNSVAIANGHRFTGTQQVDIRMTRDNNVNTRSVVVADFFIR